jgi:RNA polymerase sigma factor for flagellar operon FliA
VATMPNKKPKARKSAEQPAALPLGVDEEVELGDDDGEDDIPVLEENPSSDEEDFRLWREYKDTGNPTIRERIILKYSSFVKYVAGRMAINLPSNVDYDDLVSYGIFGLLDAIEKFDPDRNVKFKTYAKTRIRGAILDELRVLDWTPRSIRQKSKQLEKAMLELEAHLGREPTDEEICAQLGMTVKELHRLYEDTKQSLMMSLDEGDPEGEGNVSRKDFLEDVQLITPEKNAEKNELKRILAEEITKLSERERLVIVLYYFEQLTSKEIGKILGVSDSRISQLHTKAVLRLRGRLAKLRSVLVE